MGRGSACILCSPENGTPVFLRIKTGEHKVHPYSPIVAGEYRCLKRLDI
jgi:hypothetical protein